MQLLTENERIAMTGTGVILGGRESGPPLLEWVDGPPQFISRPRAYTKSEILFGPPTYQTKLTPLMTGPITYI